MNQEQTIAQWLTAKCAGHRLSLREAGDKVGLSHSTVRDVMNDVSPNGDTIKKLAEAFSNGDHEKWALEDQLLVLAGYRSEREGEETSQMIGRLMDGVAHFTNPQIDLLVHFAKFLDGIK